MQGPTLTADAVFGRDGFLLGAEAAYNVTEGRVTKYSAGGGFSAPDYAVTVHGLSNFSTFAASYYHRVSPDVEAGAKAVYDINATAPGVALEVGTKAYVHYSIRTYSCYDSCFTIILVTSTRLLSSRLKLTILVPSLSVGFRRAFKFTVSLMTFLRVGYTQALRPGVKASFGLVIDTQRLNDVGGHAGPAHKVGAQFVFEA
jgi:voltage-dependent anion channel protein 2